MFAKLICLQQYWYNLGDAITAFDLVAQLQVLAYGSTVLKKVGIKLRRSYCATQVPFCQFPGDNL
jgi:hypothetical protein